MIKAINKRITFGLVFVAMISPIILGLVLSSCFVVAVNETEIVDEINLTVPIACTMVGTGQNSHNTSITNGNYVNNIGVTTLHSFCNDYEGFAIYATGYSGNEVGGANSNKLLGSTIAIGNISTGLATSAVGNNDVSNWAMKLTKTQDSGDTSGSNAFTIDSDTEGVFSIYHTVPNSYTKVAHKNTTTDMTETTGGVKLTTTYAVYISKTQPAGTYSGQVKYTLIHPASSTPPVVCNPNATTIGEIECMQDFGKVSDANRASIINSMTAGTQYTVVDKRDEKAYTIAKLADGNVWMTQNLDLDIDSNTTYTNEDTDLGYNAVTGQYDTASWTPIRSTYATTSTQTTAWCNGGTWDSENELCEENNTPESYDPGDLFLNATGYEVGDWGAYYSSCDFSTNNPVCDQSLNPLASYVSSTGISQYHLGNYYNWAAAIATNDSSVFGVYNEGIDDFENLLADQSICPTGWTLPRGGYGDDSFSALWSAYGYPSDQWSSNISMVWSSPMYLVPNGYYNGVLGFIGTEGNYWTAVTFDSDSALYTFYNADGGSDPSVGDIRSNSMSIRCIARPVTSTIGY